MTKDKILAFWFGEPDHPGYGKPRQAWFTKNLAFDEEVRSRFLDEYQQAATGQLNHWQESPYSCLALILLLDQFSRNMFRGQPQAFATDSQALTIAQHAVSQGFDQQMLPVQRWFIYMPYEHSENLAHQRRCVELFSTLKHDPDSASTIDYAYRHLKVIERFGRFPHRNPILGRESTPEEVTFLKQPGSSF
ncbi:MAG: DUF924 family protein [Coleofasciculus sp. D1-CHI-01]|uniref:DUF924 family protein n=1 Tax=Coleofasciculus sp. D1-CHI-01 TaxID=3068482 RepID=UPI0032F54839